MKFFFYFVTLNFLFVFSLYSETSSSKTDSSSKSEILKKVDILIDKEEYEKAEELLLKLFDKHQSDDVALLLARVFSWDEKYQNSLKFYDFYLKRHPRNSKVRKEKAFVLYYLFRCRKAIPYLKKILRNDPENTEVLDAIATCYIANGYYKEGEYYLDFMNKIGRSNPKLEHELTYAKRKKIRSDFQYVGDSANFNLLNEEVSFLMPLKNWVFFYPKATFHHAWNKLHQLNLIRGELYFETPFLHYFRVKTAGGYEHVFYEKGDAGKLTLSFDVEYRYFDLLTVSLEGGLKDASYNLQTVFKDQNVDMYFFKLFLQTGIIPSVTLSSEFTYGYYTGYKSQTFYRIQNYSEVSINIYKQRILAGYMFYGTGFEKPFIGFWTPRIYQSHALFGEIVPLKWEKGAFSIRGFGGYGLEDNFSANLEGGIIYGAEGSVDFNFSFLKGTLSGGFFHSIREAGNYNYYYVRLGIEIPL